VLESNFPTGEQTDSLVSDSRASACKPPVKDMDYYFISKCNVSPSEPTHGRTRRPCYRGCHVVGLEAGGRRSLPKELMMMVRCMAMHRLGLDDEAISLPACQFSVEVCVPTVGTS